MAQEPRTIALGQHVLAGVKWKKNDGTPTEPYQNQLPTWTTARASIVSCDPSVENPGLASLRGLKLGTTDITATANFDTGSGIRQSSQVINITVSDADVPTGEIVLSYGAVKPL